MVWYGMVWCGMNGMVWMDGMVWYGWDGTARHGTARHGTVWYGMVCYSISIV